MNELTLIFLGLATILFVGIVAYSVHQQRRQAQSSKDEYADPLFAELEGRNKTDAGSRDDKREKRSKRSEPIAVTGTDQQAGEQTVAAQSEPDKTAPAAGSANGSAAARARQKRQAPELTPEQTGSGISGRGARNTATDERLVSGTPNKDANSGILTELVARVKNPEPIEQQELLVLFRAHDFKFHRRVHIYGLNQLTDLWRDIEYELPSARFVELGVAIQLADREGAMSQKELHDFQQMTLEFANKFDAPFEFSMDIDDALKQAQLLDQIGRRYDSMAVLNVVPRSKAGFRMADIESCARDLMMSTDKHGIFVKARGQKNNLTVLYRLACTDGSGHFGVSSGTMAPVHDLVIYMNVPATELPDRVFQEMIKDANNLATWLDGKVVDRNGKVMTQRSYSVLMQQISDIAYSMQQDGLTPGDAISKKLF